ncbi:uncharacterized protein LOC143024693 isoform X7 [Oratosquilla oratoria]|uniref:uncharacterized protein LOC143024693 isoform X7 n=1 Tax=Oratosquilla oratoria TaxID=337810 RepID=UPI003F7705E1
MYLRGPAVVFVVLACLVLGSFAFDVGMKNTKCNLDPAKGEVNNPCGSLYDGECSRGRCVCASGYHEDPALKRCVPGEAPKKTTGGTQSTRGGGGSLFDDDILSGYDPNKPSGGVAPQPRPPAQPQPRPPAPPQPGYPNQPQPGYPNQPQPGYPNQPQPGYPNQPQPGYPNQPQPGYPNQPQPGYPNQPQPGYPNQPRPGYPNQPQPGYPNQPQPGYPNQPHQPQPGYPTKPPKDKYGKHGPTKSHSGGGNVGEKAGGGVGGVIGLLLIGGLIYFCCIKGGKGKNILSKIPGVNFRQGGAGGQMQMQQGPPMQDPNATPLHTYVPPGQPGAPPPQAYPGSYPAYPAYPPQGAPYATEGQQPPPYTQQYQPTAPGV